MRNGGGVLLSENDVDPGLDNGGCGHC